MKSYSDTLTKSFHLKKNFEKLRKLYWQSTDFLIESVIFLKYKMMVFINRIKY